MSYFFGGDNARMLFSSDWNHKIVALAYMEQKVMESHGRNYDAEEDILIQSLIPVVVCSGDRNY